MGLTYTNSIVNRIFVKHFFRKYKNDKNLQKFLLSKAPLKKKKEKKKKKKKKTFWKMLNAE